jgi:prepilin-type N-terminal cleavage/methylation domain-containing protein
VHHRRTAGSDGFTLIELAIVIGVISVLLAAAIPLYLGVTRRSHDTSAQSSLRLALSAAKAKASTAGNYSDLDALIEGNLVITESTGASAGPLQVMFQHDDIRVTFAALSASGTCFYLQDDLSVGLRFARVPSGTCAVTAANPALAWSSSW